MGRTRIKICGVRTDADLTAAVWAGADAVGFNFVPASPRFVEPAEAAVLARRLPAFVASVAVVAGLTADEVRAVHAACPTTLIQLHGDETPELAASLPVPVVRAFRFDPATVLGEMGRWDQAENVAALLVDGSGGGQGRAFQWADLKRSRELTIPIIVAGGLTPENVGEAIRTLFPYAVDVASGVESVRGVKDPERIKRFCHAVRSADHEIYQD